jgi:hypothetical protein
MRDLFDADLGVCDLMVVWVGVDGAFDAVVFAAGAGVVFVDVCGL